MCRSKVLESCREWPSCHILFQLSRHRLEGSTLVQDISNAPRAALQATHRQLSWRASTYYSGTHSGYRFSYNTALCDVEHPVANIALAFSRVNIKAAWRLLQMIIFLQLLYYAFSTVYDEGAVACRMICILLSFVFPTSFAPRLALSTVHGAQV